MRRALLAALGIMAATACAKPPPCQLPVLPPGPPLLWKVHGDGGATVWLYGTIHSVGLDHVPPAALAALDAAPRFASELGDDDPDAWMLRTRARLPRGKGLDQQLPADDWYDLRDLLLPVIHEEDLARARPWYAMSLLTSRVGRTPKPSMDVALAARARDHGRPVDALETWDEQLAAIDQAVGIADLQEALHARKTLRCELGQLSAVYEAGDAEALWPILRGKRPELLLTARNRAWLPALEGYLHGDGAFVAVGVAHLLGDDGLPAMLTRAGYTVERVR